VGYGSYRWLSVVGLIPEDRLEGTSTVSPPRTQELSFFSFSLGGDEIGQSLEVRVIEISISVDNTAGLEVVELVELVGEMVDLQ